MPNTPIPGAPAPELSIETVGGERWSLTEQSPERFTMVVFYRGLHCPVCRGYTKELAAKLGDFAERGTEVIAVSGDDAERAARTHEEWDLGELELGHGLDSTAMDAWGLYVSSAIKDEEPERFSEPALFLIDASGAVFYAAINSMPFGRPGIGAMLDAIDFVIEQDYPPRGVVEGSAAAA